MALEDAPDFDARGLIRESYRIEGITLSECRSIFLDWAISVPLGVEARDWIEKLIDLYATANPDHPMTQVLRDGLGSTGGRGRRGGRAARLGGT